MNLSEVLDKLNCSDTAGNFVPEFLKTDYVQSEHDLVLDEKIVAENARYCSLDESVISKMTEAVRFVNSSDEVTAILIKFIFRCVFLNRLNPLWDRTVIQRVVPEYADVLYLAIASGYVPLIRKLHSELGIPEKITHDTCYQVRAYCDNHIVGTGRPGIYANQLSWLLAYIHPEELYIRLGRLEFQYQPCYWDDHVFRNRKDGSLLCFASNGVQFDKYGFALSSDPQEPGLAFKSVYVEDSVKREIKGHPVDPEGRTAAEPMTISLDEYEKIIAKGTPILSMHIPSGGGMTPVETERSFKMAKNFFTSFFQDENKRPKAVMSASWIFNPNLPEFLSPDTNLVRLEKRVHLIPRACRETDGLWFIFLHENAFDPETVPRKTSLQRAVLDYIAKGNRWRIGGMYLTLDEI